MHQKVNQAHDGKGQSKMELKVFKDTIAAYGGRWEARLELPVETEILIPDYLPAVFKIVKCRIEPVLLQNRITGGRWQSEGYLRCTVYYQSDEPGCHLYRTEQKFAFEKAVELPAGRYMEGPAQVWGETEYCNCRAVSEHRIDLRGAYILFGAVLAAKECELLTSLADCGIEQRTRELQGMHRIAVEEKTLTAETELPLPDAEEESVLDIAGTFTLGSAALQTGQADIQGTLQAQICYQPAGTEKLTVRQTEIPVQQTVELPGVAEEDRCIAWGEVIACTLSAAEGTGEADLALTWKLHVEVWHEVRCTVVADAYSTLCQTQTVQTSCKLLHPAAELNGQVEVVIEDDLPDADLTVAGCFVTLGAAVPTDAGRDGEKTVCLSGKGTAHVLCADPRGELTCYDKTFTWKPEGDWTGTAADTCVCMGACVTRVSSSKNGARLRVELTVQCTGLLLQAECGEALCDVELGEEYAAGSDGPALHLYYARQGERVFDIAKRYHARCRDLAAANHLEADGVAPQELTTENACLLIPAAL